MNIQATLDECRAELKRQQVEFDAGIIMLHDLASMKDTEQRAIIQAVNHNPARLKVAEELCAMADWEMNDLAGSHDPAEAHHFLKLAAALLGVEVVE